MSELKPCPFCNGSQEATQDSREKWRGSHECDFVDPSAWFDTYEEFKEAWNARCERTDSLEQWARDMLAYLDPVDAAEFRDRLEALGVEL